MWGIEGGIRMGGRRRSSVRAVQPGAVRLTPNLLALCWHCAAKHSIRADGAGGATVAQDAHEPIEQKLPGVERRMNPNARSRHYMNSTPCLEEPRKLQ